MNQHHNKNAITHKLYSKIHKLYIITQNNPNKIPNITTNKTKNPKTSNNRPLEYNHQHNPNILNSIVVIRPTILNGIPYTPHKNNQITFTNHNNNNTL